MVEDEVYSGLCKVVGRRNISRFLNDLARPHVVRESLVEGYRAMAADERREAEALEWSEGLIDPKLAPPSFSRSRGNPSRERRLRKDRLRIVGRLKLAADYDA